MEETPEPPKVQSNISTLKDQLIDEADLTLTTKDKKDDKTCEDVTPKETESEKPPDSPARRSPDPSCAICLSSLQNKSFTDSCFHMFCFTCLVEWSKVKAECPLCKQRFKSIVHNVRSIEDYDQYFLNSKNNDWLSNPSPRFRYATTMTPARLLERRQRYLAIAETMDSRIAAHRLLFAPHSVSTQTSVTAPNIPCNLRRRVYETDMWVKTTSTRNRRVRTISPEFFRKNPACTHRLIPWLNRELVALLNANETQVTFVLELIMALIARYDIQSQEFFVHIEPYLNHWTNHFVYEFYNFAISPFDMEHYDQRAVYERMDPFSNSNNAAPSSPGNNDIITLQQSTSSSRSEHRSKKSKHAYKRLKKLVLKRNHENDSWQPVVTIQQSSSSSSIVSSSEAGSNALNQPGPSTSRPSLILELESIFDTTDESSDGCQIVGELKPKNMRTPEVVTLLSSDEEPQPVQTVTLSSDDETKPFWPQSEDTGIAIESVVSLGDLKRSVGPIAILDNELVSQSETEQPQPSSSTNVDSDPQHYGPFRSRLPSDSSDHKDSSSLTSNDWVPYSKAKYQNERPSRHSPVLWSCDSSEDGDREESPKPKRPKLRSVVVAADSSSRHSSSHRRHKEKRKKKKKHRRRSHSTNSD